MIGDIKGKYDRLGSDKDIKSLNALTLAYIGDTVYDLYVRNHLICTGDYKTGKLHLMAVAHVSAAAQARALDAVEGMFTEEEAEIIKRAKNTKNATIPKNASPKTYKKATALEALIGYLYLSEKKERLIEVLDAAYEANSKNGG
jgi:ribonuclease-3 family protein